MAATASWRTLGRESKVLPRTPKGKAQRNFTDPDLCIMKNSDKAFIQAYNAQAVADRGESQVIVVGDLTNQALNMTYLSDMVKQIELNLDRRSKKLLADAGYCSEENATFLER
jgi:hypothetical protein